MNVMDDCETPEQKLKVAIQAMREAISQEKEPKLKDFWAIREQAIPLFKEGIHPAVRVQFWSELSDLSKEARSLKTFLNKEAAFVTEQMERTMGAVEMRLERVDDEMETICLPPTPLKGLEPLQKEIQVLNGCAETVNSLRKELIEVRLRISVKNPLFSRLSLIGDRIFPRRRELVEALSCKFCEEVEEVGKGRRSPRETREMIQSLQQAAKVFTLNTKAFGRTRDFLGEQWDQMREAEKSHRRKKTLHEKNFQMLLAEVEQATEEEIDALYQKVKGTDLGWKEKKILDSTFAKRREALYYKAEEEWLARKPSLEALSHKRDELKEKQRNLKGISGMGMEEAMKNEALYRETSLRLAKIEGAIADANRAAGRDV